MRPQTPVTYEQDNCRANTPTDRQEFVLIRLRIRPRCWHYTATQTTPSLVPYYYPTRQWLLRLQSNRPNDRADTPVIQRPIDRSSSECSTYYHYLMLAPYCHQNWHLAALPAAAYLGTTILCFYNLLATYSGTTILRFYFVLNWFYFVLDWFYFILLEYMDKSYIVICLGTAVLRTKERTASVGI